MPSSETNDAKAAWSRSAMVFAKARSWSATWRARFGESILRGVGGDRTAERGEQKDNGERADHGQHLEGILLRPQGCRVPWCGYSCRVPGASYDCFLRPTTTSSQATARNAKATNGG